MIQFLTAAAATDRRLVRKKNEDSFLCLPSHGVFVVADGIGGASGGDIASRAVCQHIQDAFETPVSAALVLADKVKLIRDAVNTASAWLRITAKRINLLRNRIAQAQKKHTEPMTRSAYADFSNLTFSSKDSSRFPDS